MLQRTLIRLFAIYCIPSRVTCKKLIIPNKISRNMTLISLALFLSFFLTRARQWITLLYREANSLRSARHYKESTVHTRPWDSSGYVAVRIFCLARFLEDMQPWVRPAVESAWGPRDPTAVEQAVWSVCRVGPRSLPVGQSGQSRRSLAEGLRRICTVTWNGHSPNSSL